ncbi:hypothetical protein GCM10022209_11270 [Chitinophaga oryziterrae]
MSGFKPAPFVNVKENVAKFVDLPLTGTVDGSGGTYTYTVYTSSITFKLGATTVGTWYSTYDGVNTYTFTGMQSATGISSVLLHHATWDPYWIVEFFSPF